MAAFQEPTSIWQCPICCTPGQRRPSTSLFRSFALLKSHLEDTHKSQQYNYYCPFPPCSTVIPVSSPNPSETEASGSGTRSGFRFGAEAEETAGPEDQATATAKATHRFAPVYAHHKEYHGWMPVPSLKEIEQHLHETDLLGSCDLLGFCDLLGYYHPLPEDWAGFCAVLEWKCRVGYCDESGIPHLPNSEIGNNLRARLSQGDELPWSMRDEGALELFRRRLRELSEAMDRRSAGEVGAGDLDLFPLEEPPLF